MNPNYQGGTSTMRQQLENIRAEALAAIQNAADKADLEALKKEGAEA